MGVRVRRSPEGFDQIPCDEGVVDCSHHLWKRFYQTTFPGLTFPYRHNTCRRMFLHWTWECSNTMKWNAIAVFHFHTSVKHDLLNSAYNTPGKELPCYSILSHYCTALFLPLNQCFDLFVKVQCGLVTLLPVPSGLIHHKHLAKNVH